MSDAISLTDARDTLGDLVAKVRHTGERVTLSKNGKQVAVLISTDDLKALEAFEDAEDVRAYDEAKAEFEADGRKTVSLDDLRSDHDELTAQGR